MALTLVTGPANSAKAGEVLGAYGAVARRGAVLVVPTAEDARHYTRELAEQGVVQGSVLTFGGLAAEIARRVDYGGRRLSALQRERVLERVLARLSLDALRASAGAAGFAGAAGELIAELQRELITPQRLTVALRAWSAQDVRRAPFARDVGRIYGDYVRELDRLGRVDRELYAWRALDALRAAPARWGRDAAFFYGFDDLTALERDAIETLARVVGVAVTVSLTYEAGREALVARAPAVEELRPLAESVTELPAQDEHYAPGSRRVLHHLERSLFEPDAQRIDAAYGDPVVTLLEAGGERAEAELVAAHVLELRRAGVPASEIVVVHRSRERAAPLLARVFDQYGIALGAGGQTAFGHTALGRAVLGAARCALDPEAARPEDLLDLLRAPGLLHTPEIADALEAEVRRRGLRTAAQAREHLEWVPDELDEIAAAGAAGGDPGPALGRLARRLLAAPYRHGAPQLDRDEALDARALAALHRALEELAELALRPVATELIELLAALAVPGARALAGDEVLFAEPAEIRARRFAAVFVCGLQEGEFPRAGRAEPFFSDERRRELAAASGLRLRPREDALAGERYLFYAAVSRATERLFLAYRSSDEEGNLALASPFVSDVADLLDDGWRSRRRRRLIADVVWDPAYAPTVRERDRALAAARAPLTGDEPDARRTLGPAALERMRHSRILSPGALEAYANCPVRWLIERQLEPRPMAPDPDPITRGTLMHDVLERLLAELGGPVTPDTLDAAGVILDRLVAELAGGEAARLAVGESAVVRAGALRAIEADLRRYLQHEAATGRAWRPLGLELRFGFDDEGALPPLVLRDRDRDRDGDRDGDDVDGEGDDEVRVRGVIDRIDVDDHGHAVVRDYKSGNARPGWPVARWRAERQLQVALYMLVVRRLLGLDAIAGVYQPLRGDDLRARGVFVADTPLGAFVHERDGRSAEEVDAELGDAEQRALELARRLRGGELTPCPSTCSRDGCAYPSICRSQ
jgi:ATP-dependent helicase/DNAse subunit B